MRKFSMQSLPAALALSAVLAATSFAAQAQIGVGLGGGLGVSVGVGVRDGVNANIGADVRANSGMASNRNHHEQIAATNWTGFYVGANAGWTCN